MPIFDKLQGTQAESFIVNSRKQAGADAALQVDSTTRGALLPRVTTAQKMAIVSPRNGLEVWDSTLKCKSVYRDGVWVCLVDVERDETWVGIHPALSAGMLCYVSANITASPSDARDLAKARCAGCYNGVSGRIKYDGVIDAMIFSAASSTPTPGSPVYVAKADDEPADAAAGKATADKPTYPAFPCEVGIVLSVNPITFPSTRVAKVLLQVKKIDSVRRTGVVLAGSIDNINQVFVAPDKFIHESGIRSVEVYYNGQRLLETDDYTVSESGGVGTGYDTVTMQIAPRSHGTNIDKVWADYWVG